LVLVLDGLWKQASELTSRAGIAIFKEATCSPLSGMRLIHRFILSDISSQVSVVGQ
jgi:hypothetical protein